MIIDVRAVGGRKYCEAIIKEGNGTLETGLMDMNEALEFVRTLLEAADDVLCYVDGFEGHHHEEMRRLVAKYLEASNGEMEEEF